METQLNLIDVPVKHKTRQAFTEVGRKRANGLYIGGGTS